MAVHLACPCSLSICYKIQSAESSGGFTKVQKHFMSDCRVAGFLGSFSEDFMGGADPPTQVLSHCLPQLTTVAYLPIL